MAKETKDALKIARKAGNILLKAFKSHELIGLRGSAKGAVTKYDKEVDEMIRSFLRTKYPADALLTEEGEVEGTSGRRWIVDSLDGTVNFTTCNPLWSVLIAREEGGEVTVGVIYAPAIGETYVAEKGKGAFLNGKPIKVSKNEKLESAYVYFCEGGVEDREETAPLFKTIYPQVRDLRKIGSAGLEMAWVAAGRADGYITTQIEPWDVASGVLLLQEAGGSVTTFGGTPWTLKTHDIVASNGLIHNDLLKLI